MTGLAAEADVAPAGPPPPSCARRWVARRWWCLCVHLRQVHAGICLAWFPLAVKHEQCLLDYDRQTGQNRVKSTICYLYVLQNFRWDFYALGIPALKSLSSLTSEKQLLHQLVSQLEKQTLTDFRVYSLYQRVGLRFLPVQAEQIPPPLFVCGIDRPKN